MESPKKPAKKKAPQAAKEEPPEPSVLETAAQAIGSAIGTIAVKTGIAHPQTAPKVRIGKLVKKDKHRVPRKLKKKLQKQSG